MSDVLNEGSSLGAKAEAEIEIDLSPRIGHIIAEAIRPELEESLSDRSNVKLTVESEGKIILHISAVDTSALRAALNSYLRWISAITKTLNVFEDLMH